MSAAALAAAAIEAIRLRAISSSSLCVSGGHRRLAAGGEGWHQALHPIPRRRPPHSRYLKAPRAVLAAAGDSDGTRTRSTRPADREPPPPRRSPAGREPPRRGAALGSQRRAA